MQRLIRHISAFATVLAIVFAMFISSCSDPRHPENLEPIIEALDAEDVTRTEAVISAQVQNRGLVNLTYVKFHYGETGNIDREAIPDNPDASVVTVRLAGLKPGTEYSWYVEGGTATATIRSDIKSFKTLPNDPPAISDLDVLATGPTGLIVAFEIVEDGGDPLLDAGCEITNIATGDKSRIYVPSEGLVVGTHRVHISGLAMKTRYSIAPFASNRYGTTVGEPMEYTTQNSFMLNEAGTLSQLFTEQAGDALDKLTISGQMNGDDFRFLRGLLGAPAVGAADPAAVHVGDVDLFDANIVEGGASYDGSRFVVANELSTGLFADCVKLRRIKLPATATVMARDAFARCEALTSLDINSEITKILPSEGCVALSTIDVSSGNPHFASVDGVLFDKDVTSILWFPLGKTGDYALPPTVTAIGESAFFGTKISSLEIPPSVTSIGRGAFAGSSLTEITFPDNLTNISESMMQGCASLTTVKLGSGTLYVGNYAFAGTSLSNLYVSATVPPFACEEAFGSITKSCVLHVPKGCKAVYSNHPRWGQFLRIVEF